MFNISDVSWILLSIFKTSGYKHLSTNIDRFSTAVPQLLVITHAGVLSLSVLTRPYISSGSACDGSINFCQVLHRTPFRVHFLIHKFTLSQKVFDGS